MKIIGACFIKLGGNVRLALIQEDDNGRRSAIPVKKEDTPPTPAVGMVILQTPFNIFEEASNAHL